MHLLDNLEITPVDNAFAPAIQSAIDLKTKPPGSLGKIESLALKIALAQNTVSPEMQKAHLLLFAGDHGLVQEGVSAWPSEVTTQMVANFLQGGAAANVFAATNDISMQVVDAGIVGNIEHPDLVSVSIAKGTANSMNEDAMSASQLSSALNAGADLAIDAIANGAHCIAIGEMGIGNTSAATLLTHKLTGQTVAELSGPGAGLDDAGLTNKIKILEKAAARTNAPLNGIDALRAYGGFEIAMMAGAAIGAASKGAITLVDGFIASSAVLCATNMRPNLAPYLAFAHKSKEPGHAPMLAAMAADPLLDLDMRLGEGTGALLAFPLLRCACAMLRDMATFESAEVSGKN